MGSTRLKLISAIIVWSSLLFSDNTLAVTARIFTFPIPNGQTIDPNTEHFSVSVDGGYISSKGGFGSIFYDTKSATFVVESTINFQEGSPQKVVVTHTIDDPTSKMNRPLGYKGLIYPDIPGDISSIDTKVSISISKNQIVGQTLMALEKNKSTLPAQIFSSTWLGYTQTVSTLIDVFFGSNSQSTPISGQTNVPTPKQESYIVLVSSDHDNDSALNNLSASDLSYDPQSNVLKKNSQAITNWTYVVFRLGYKSSVNINRLAYGSDAPWATIINTQLATIALEQVSDKKQLGTVANNVLESLKNLQKFLSTEHSFSNYDRAIGLHYLVKNKIKVISDYCKRKKFNDCPVDGLAQYKNNLENIFGIAQDSLAVAFQAIELQNRFAMTSMSKTSTAFPASVITSTIFVNADSVVDITPDPATAITLDDFKTFVKRKPAQNQPATVGSTYRALTQDVKENPKSYKTEDAQLFIHKSE